LDTLKSELRQLLTEMASLPENFDEKANLYSDLGMASIQAMELLMVLEERYGVSVPDEEFVEATSLESRRFRLFSGYWVHIEPAAVEVDGVDEVLPIAKSACRVLHPLDLCVERFAARVGDAVAEIGDYVFGLCARIWEMLRFTGILIFVDSGYTRLHEGERLDEGIGLAWIQGIPARDR
jgi:acyl carrier protein